MKTIALIGSPRKDGNCDQIVSRLLDNIDGYTKKYYWSFLALYRFDWASINKQRVSNHRRHQYKPPRNTRIRNH